MPDVEFSEIDSTPNEVNTRSREERGNAQQDQNKVEGCCMCNCHCKYKRAIYETLKWFNFYIMKWAILSCLVTVLCIFMVACCNVALQMILMTEKSYEENGNRKAQRCMLYFAMPSTVLLWVLFSGYVLSRQGELIYVAYHIPYYTEKALDVAEVSHANRNMRMRLINLSTPLTSHRTSEPLPNYNSAHTTHEFGLGIFILFGLFLFLLSVVMTSLSFFDLAVFFLLLGAFSIFIGCSVHEETQTSRLYNMVAPIYCFMLVLAGFLQFYPTPDWNSPAYTKLVVTFVGTTLVLCGLHILIELWFHPLCFFYNKSKNTTLYFEGYTLYAPFGAAICLFVSFILFYNGSQEDISADYALRFTFFVVLVSTLGLSILNTAFFEDVAFEENVDTFKQMVLFMYAVILFVMFVGMNIAALWKDWGWFFLFSFLGYILPAISIYYYERSYQKVSIRYGILAIVVSCIISLVFANEKALLFLTVSCHGTLLVLYHLAEREKEEQNELGVAKEEEQFLFVFSFKIASFSGMSSHCQRLYTGFVCPCFLVVLTLLFFAAWSQQSSMYRNHNPGSQPVYDFDKKKGMETYPICSSDFHSLDVIDLAYMTELTYLKDPGTGESCGETGSKAELQLCIDKYFTRNYTKRFKGSDEYMPYNWVVDYFSYNETRRGFSQNVVYYGAYSKTADVFVIGVRGSTTGRDWLENANLYSEIVLLQGFSFLVPMIYIWPFEATAIMVKVMSYSESLSLLTRNPYGYRNSMAESYYLDVENYLNKIRADDQYNTTNFLVVGHSLGGATAGITGARNNIDSLTFEPPGLIYSHEKFNIEGNLASIDETATSIVRDNDPVTFIDQQGGLVQNVICDHTFMDIYCHLLHPITCHMMYNCGALNRTSFARWGFGEGYCN